jgi:hypothetical protein
MEPGSNWYELNDRHYKLHQFNTIKGEMKGLDFYNSRVAVAKWGGPVAATKNLERIVIMKAEDIVKDSICFFSNDGRIISKVVYKDLDKVI